VNSILHLQPRIGNQMVERMLQTNSKELGVGLASPASPRFAYEFSRIPVHAKSPKSVQAKLTVSPAGDIYEQEADLISERVMRMPEPLLQRGCPCGGGRPKCQMEQLGRKQASLQTKRVSSGDLGHSEVPPIVHEVLSSPGQRLDTATRDFMEPLFGYDLGGIRIHTDPKAAKAAQAIGALAFTVGHDVAFGPGQYLPGTSKGKGLLAHELTHVIQHRGIHKMTGAQADRGAAGADITTQAKQSEVSRKHEPGFGNKPRALTPAETRKFRQWEGGVDEALNVLTPLIHIRGNAFLDQWLTQMISAKSDAQPPTEEEEDYWVVALLGNLLWAASVFVPGAGVIKGMAAGEATFKVGADAFVEAGRAGLASETARATGIAVEMVAEAGMTNLGKAMFATMAMGGSLAASGVVQRWATDPSGDPTGKELVAMVLNTKRKEMGKALERLQEHFAYDLVLSGLTFERFQKGRTEFMTDMETALWANLFPSVQKDDLNAIYKSGLNAINGALADFRKQYRIWKDLVQGCANRFVVPMTQIPHAEEWPEAIRSGREQPLEYCRRRLPFKPKLDF
jgi:hypothetical protein